MWSKNETTKYPDLKNAILLVALFLIFQMIASYFVGALAEITGRAISAAAWGMVNILAFLAIMQLVIKRTGVRTREIIGPGRLSLVSIIAIVPTCIGSLLLLTELQSVLQQIVPVSDRLKNSLELIYNPDDVLGVILMVCLVAPFTEEIIFRGVILSGFLKNYHKLEALLLSSWLFGFIHLNLWQYIGAFFLGLLLGLIYMRTKSVIPSMLCHGLYNGSTLVIDKVWTYLFMRFSLPILIINVSGVALLVIGVILLIQSTKSSYKTHSR